MYPLKIIYITINDLHIVITITTRERERESLDRFNGKKPLLFQGGLEQRCLDSSRRQNSHRIR